jgi:hypothetical protein
MCFLAIFDLKYLPCEIEGLSMNRLRFKPGQTSCPDGQFSNSQDPTN